jgi:hypothetical protein
VHERRVFKLSGGERAREPRRGRQSA